MKQHYLFIAAAILVSLTAVSSDMAGGLLSGQNYFSVQYFATGVRALEF